MSLTLLYVVAVAVCVGGPTGWYISVLHRRLAAAVFDATHDPLTGVYNRRLLHTAITGHTHGREPFAVVLVDIDRFKDINDLYGHAAGDAVLVELAHRLTLAGSGISHVFRLGGDEFALLVTGDSDHAVAVGKAVWCLAAGDTVPPARRRAHRDRGVRRGGRPHGWEPAPRCCCARPTRPSPRPKRRAPWCGGIPARLYPRQRRGPATGSATPPPARSSHRHRPPRWRPAQTPAQGGGGAGSTRHRCTRSPSTPQPATTTGAPTPKTRSCRTAPADWNSSPKTATSPPTPPAGPSHYATRTTPTASSPPRHPTSTRHRPAAAGCRRSRTSTSTTKPSTPSPSPRTGAGSWK